MAAHQESCWEEVWRIGDNHKWSSLAFLEHFNSRKPKRRSASSATVCFQAWSPTSEKNQEAAMTNRGLVRSHEAWTRVWKLELTPSQMVDIYLERARCISCPNRTTPRRAATHTRMGVCRDGRYGNLSVILTSKDGMNLKDSCTVCERLQCLNTDTFFSRNDRCGQYPDS